jgi:cytochrome c oxidase subunit I
MSSVGKLFAIAAILVLIVGVLRWPTLGTGYYSIAIRNRGYAFGQDYWAFSIGAIFAALAAVYYWFPVLFSRSLGVWISQLHFWLSAVAAFGFLLLAPGLQELIAPRGLASSSQRADATVLGVAIISTMLFLVAQFIFVASFFWSAIHRNAT